MGQDKETASTIPTHTATPGTTHHNNEAKLYQYLSIGPLFMEALFLSCAVLLRSDLIKLEWGLPECVLVAVRSSCGGNVA